MSKKIVKAEIKKNRIKWIKALLSGRYKQTRGRLCRQDDKKHCSYCCLGVAGTVFRAKKAVKNEHSWEVNITIDERLYDLSDSLRAKLDIDKNLEDELVSMNDNEAKSFQEIGKFLQKTWKITNKDLGLTNG